MNILKPVLTFTALTLLTGCATVKVSSNVQKNYDKRIDSVYALFSSSAAGSWGFLGELKTELSKRFEQRNIRSMIHVRDILAVDEKKTIASEMELFKPLYILELSQTSKTSQAVNYAPGAGTGYEYGAGFELSLSEIGSDTAIWKASITTGGGGGGYKGALPSSQGAVGSPGKTADELIATLIRDGLIPTAPPVR